ncbi:MAG TPA: hypothetical protein DEA08_10880 [Planctomycetes bacterium]|nr:hypothetical protein [Planctomycetota bacterium]
MQVEFQLTRAGAEVSRGVLAAGQRLVAGSGEGVGLRLEDGMVSAQHLALELRPDGLFATDLDSMTGTLLAGRALPPNQPVALAPGAVLQLGDHRLSVRPLEAPSGIRVEYERLGELGKGAAGTVFHARHRASGREVAIKLLHEQVDEVERERFLREGAVCRRIQSPHVVAVYETRVEGPLAFMVMELVRGPSLRQHLQQGPLQPADALRVGLAITRGLAAAHAVGVIHRDLKPANVLSTPEGVIKVADFGLAKDTQSAEQLTKTRQGMGTLAFLSPEQAHDSKRVDPRSDLYGVGAVLYRCLAGRPVFDAPGMEIVNQIYDEEPAPLSELAPGCPEPLCELVHWLLEKDPDDRPPTAELLLQELSKLAPG